MTDIIDKYLLQIKIIAAAGLVSGLIATGVWIRNAFAERDEYKREAELQKAQAAIVTQQFNEYIRLNNNIAEAIRKVKVQSDVYIQGVEDAPKPQAAAGERIVLVAAGMPQAPDMPRFQNHSAGRAATNTP